MHQRNALTPRNLFHESAVSGDWTKTNRTGKKVVPVLYCNLNHAMKAYWVRS